MKIGAGDPYPVAKPKPGELIVFPDALAGQAVYRIVGAPAGKAETCAAEDVGTSKQSDTRELRFVVYRWPKSSDFLAVLQYRFVGIGAPAGNCWSLGRIVHVSRVAERWLVTEDQDIGGQHHGGLERIEMTDLSGDGVDELLVESDWGGAGTFGSSLLVYSLQSGHFQPWLNVTSRLEGIDESFTQTLNLGSTRASNARIFCFTKTDLGADGQLFRPRRVSEPCYPRGSGLDGN